MEKQHQFNNLSNAPEYLCNQVKYVSDLQSYQLRKAMQKSLFYERLMQNCHGIGKKCVNFVSNNSYNVNIV